MVARRGRLLNDTEVKKDLEDEEDDYEEDDDDEDDDGDDAFAPEEQFDRMLKGTLFQLEIRVMWDLLFGIDVFVRL